MTGRLHHLGTVCGHLLRQASLLASLVTKPTYCGCIRLVVHALVDNEAPRLAVRTRYASSFRDQFQAHCKGN